MCIEIYRRNAMKMVSYDNVVFPDEFCGVCDSNGGDYDKWPDYEALLDMMSKEFLKDRYALCLQLKKDDEMAYEFTKVPCLALFLEQLKIRKI
jgi:hypothetical protein